MKKGVVICRRARQQKQQLQTAIRQRQQTLEGFQLGFYGHAAGPQLVHDSRRRLFSADALRRHRLLLLRQCMVRNLAEDVHLVKGQLYIAIKPAHASTYETQAATVDEADLMQDPAVDQQGCWRSGPGASNRPS